MKKNLLFFMVLGWQLAYSQAEVLNPVFPFWKVKGNGGTTVGTNFIGTTDAQPLEMKVNNQKAAYLDYGTPYSAAMGYQALNVNTGVNNAAFGYHALRSNTTGYNNTAMGAFTLSSNTTGYYNTAMGYALQNNTTGYNNTAVGDGSLVTNTTGNNNTGFGGNALFSNTTGTLNTAVGVGALNDNTTGTLNTAVGVGALHDNTTGTQNTAVGLQALYEATTGSGNTAIGYQACANNNTGNPSARNTAIGWRAMDNNASGKENTVVGYDADVLNTSLTNASAFGAYATVGSSNSLVLGNNANVGIGTSYPVEKLHVVGSIRMVDGNQAAGYIPVSDVNGTMTWTNPATITTAADGDGNSTNELQTLSVSGNQVTLSNGGGTVTVDDGDWTVSGNNIYNANSGNVGIGNTSPTAKLQVTPSSGTGVLIDRQNGQPSIEGGTSAGSWLMADGNVTYSGKMGINYYSAGDVIMVNGGGRVGIGTTNPTEAKLVVNGTGPTGTHSYGYLNSGGNTGTSSNQTTAYSIWASNRIRASEFNAMSDERSKFIVQRSDKAEMLNLVNRLTVTEYSYIDTVQHGNMTKQGFIAQEIEKVYPNAVNRSSDFIPNVFARSSKISYDSDAKIATITVAKVHGFAVGDKVKLMTNNETLHVTVKKVPDARTFTVNMEAATGAVFVYGKQVTDFRAVDYDQLFSIGIGAIQELWDKLKALEAENATLKTELQTEKNSYKARLHRIEQVLVIDTKAQQ